MPQFTVTDFRKTEKRTRSVHPKSEGGGHGGGDTGLARTFVEAVRTGDQRVLGTDIKEVTKSHVTVFAAEQSRLLGGQVVLVEEFEKKSMDEMWTYLGLPKKIPLLVEEVDPSGAMDSWHREPKVWEDFKASGSTVPFAPRWHQLVAIAKLMEQVLAGRSTMLMDSVGVGKTLSVIGTIVMYQWCREGFDRFAGRFPGLLGK